MNQVELLVVSGFLFIGAAECWLMAENDGKFTSTLYLLKEGIQQQSNRHFSFMNPEAQNNSQVVGQLGGKALINCYTLFLGDHLVIWLKRDEERLLTAGKQVYSSEGRYSIAHIKQQKLWELTIRDLRMSDEGLYECQLTSHPPVSLFFRLKVIEAKAVIRGRQDLQAREGTSVRLFCHVQDATESNFFVFWFHNGSMINYKSRSETTITRQQFGSTLTIARVSSNDAGVYTCEPYLARADNVTLYVIKGKEGFTERTFIIGGNSSGEKRDAFLLVFLVWTVKCFIFKGF